MYGLDITLEITLAIATTSLLNTLFVTTPLLDSLPDVAKRCQTTQIESVLSLNLKAFQGHNVRKGETLATDALQRERGADMQSILLQGSNLVRLTTHRATRLLQYENVDEVKAGCEQVMVR